MSGLMVIPLIVIVILLAYANKQKTVVRRINPKTGDSEVVEVHETGPGPAETIARAVVFLVLGVGMLFLLLVLAHC